MKPLININPEYVYVMIPAEYVCVYHRLLVMLADYGEDMLKDCKANYTEKNIQIIECFNMFNSAVAAHKLEKYKLAEVLIKYVKTRINNIYKGFDNSTSLVFPVDEHGDIKAFVSCGERPLFRINADDGELYEHKFNNGFDEHFNLSIADRGIEPRIKEKGLIAKLIPRYEVHIKPKHHIKLDEYEDYLQKEYLDRYPEHDYPETEEPSEDETEDSEDSADVHYHTKFIYGESHTYEHGGKPKKPKPPVEEEKEPPFIPYPDDTIYHPCADIYVYFEGEQMPIDKVDVHKYFDDREILTWHDIKLTKEDVGEHSFKIVVNYHEHTTITETKLFFKLIEESNEDTNS